MKLVLVVTDSYHTQKHGGFPVERCYTMFPNHKNGEGGVNGGHVGQIYHTYVTFGFCNRGKDS